MSKFERVDHLMEQAVRPVAPAHNPAAGTEETRDAEAVLEARVSAVERGVPEAPEPVPAEARTPVLEVRPGAPQVSPAERGRQLLGALRPFLPVVGNALRMVDHGAVQAIGRMLPALEMVGVARAAEAQRPARTPALATALDALEKRQAELARDIADCQQESTMQAEKLRKLRESLERVVAEQGALSHRLNHTEDRIRLMSAGFAIMLMLVITEFVLLFVFRRP